MPWLLPISACVVPDPAPSAPGSIDTGARELRPEVSWSEEVANVAFVAVEAEGPWQVEYGLPGGEVSLTPPTTAEKTAVLGLKSGRTYEARVVESAGRSSPPFLLPVPEAPIALPSLEILSRTEDAEMGRGHVLTALSQLATEGFGDTFVAIYDGDGDPVWWQRSTLGHITMTPSLGATPGTILWDDYDWSVPMLDASAVRIGLDGSDRRQVALPWGHHAVIELEPGILAWAARDVRPSPSEPGASITADRLFEAPLAGTASPREVTALYDAVFGGRFSPPCGHPSTALTLGGISPLYEWSHLNSVVWLPERDAILLHLRWIDGLVLVDRPSGEILWQMSGPYGEFVGADGEPLWDGSETSILSHAHLSQAWDGGLVAFDNGNHRRPPRPSIVELAWDERRRTVEEVFRWYRPDGLEVSILGDVRKLPGGGYLASWSTAGEITEIAPDGRVRWRARTRDGQITLRLVYLGSLYPDTGGGPS